jgi:nitrile hydratase
LSCRFLSPPTPNIKYISTTSSQQQYLPHDIGGNINYFGKILPYGDDVDNLQQWEQQCHALFAILAQKKYVKTDQLRRSIEALTPDQYSTWGYYEKWTAAMVTLLLDDGIISYNDLKVALFGTDHDNYYPNGHSVFQPGEKVRVKPYQQHIAWRRPHIRTPGYIYGVHGKVVDVCGQFDDPSFLAFGLEAPKVWLYRIEVSMADLWPEQSSSKDTVSVEIYEHWLEPSKQNSGHAYEDLELLNHDDDGHDCVHHHSHSHHDHPHDHDGDHSHDPRPHVEKRAAQKEEIPRPGSELFNALYKLVVEKNLVSKDEIRSMVEALDTAGKTLKGATLVVKAWVDSGFKDRLLKDPSAAALEVGIETSNPNAPTVLTVVENTPSVHNLVVCTLCSCYPSALLGVAPSWYKQKEFRARSVRDPRSVLGDFGTYLNPNQSIKVHDSTADHRYIVLPQRPAGTEDWSEDELRTLVTRDTMIGVSNPILP